MIWLWVVVLVIVIGAIAIFAAGRDTSMSEAYEDRPDTAIPSGRALNSDDLHDVRFTTAVRGYRMDEVDAFIDRLREEFIARERGARTRQSPGPEQVAPAEHVHVHESETTAEPGGEAEVSEAEKLGLQPSASAEDAATTEESGIAEDHEIARADGPTDDGDPAEQPVRAAQPVQAEQPVQADEPDEPSPQGRHSATGHG